MIQVIDYHLQYSALMYFCLMAWCFFDLRKKYGYTAATLMFYSGVSSIYVWIFANNRYVTVDPYNQMALRYFSADSFAKTELIVVGMTALIGCRKVFLKNLSIVCKFFVLLNVAFMSWQFAQHRCVVGNSCIGVIGNPSIAVGLMIAMLPLFVTSWKKDWWILASVVAAVFMSRSSIGIGMLAAYTCLWLFPWKMSPKAFMIGAVNILVLLALLFGIGHLLLGWELFFTSSRLTVWHFMMERWFLPKNILFGTGWGTYHVFSINLQNYGNVEPGNYWNTMHQDFLQIIFETGLLGGILAISTYFVALSRMLIRKEYRVALSAALFGIYMSMNPAFHFPYPIIFGAALFLYCLKRETLQCGALTS